MFLSGKTALVTGASGLIGSAIAIRLAEEGAAVFLHYNSDPEGANRTKEAIVARGGTAELLSADLGAVDGPAALTAQIDSVFDGQYSGRLDILINNAGIFEFGGLTEITDEEFDRMFLVNVRSPFQLARAAAKRMQAAGWGRIINIGSVFGEGAFIPGVSAYAGSKAALKGLTQGWSRDLGRHGITVNAVQPALIQAEPLPTEGPVYESMRLRTGVGRFGRAEEVANAVAFLAGPEAGFITGTSLNVEGGWLA